MNKITMLSLHNLGKSKGQYISFGLVLFLSALITNIALVLAFQTSKAYDARFEYLNTADLNILIPQLQDYDALSDELSEIEGITEAEKHRAVFAEATVREFAGSDFTMNTVFYNLNDVRNINLLDFPDRTNRNPEHSVYVPSYMAQLGGFSAGNDITYSIGGTDEAFHIAGTVSEMQYGNYGTGLIGAYLPDMAYNAFAEKNSSSLVTEYSLKTGSFADYAYIKNEISHMLSDRGVTVLSINDRETGKQSRTMVCSLIIVIFISFALAIFFVSICLSNFRIRNTIAEEMADMGVLKAMGYTSKMIIASTVLPYTVACFLAAAAGAGVSYAILPFLANILAIQSGFSYNPHFDIYAMLMTVLLQAIAVLIFSCFAASRIRSLEPINAIRGITGNSAVKNHFPLESTKGNTVFILILKQTASSAGQNVLLFMVSFSIMVLLSFSGTLLYNVSIKSDNFINTLSEESPSVVFTVNEGKIRELKTVLKQDPQTDRAIEYGAYPVSCQNGNLTAFVCEDFSLVTNDICYEGRNPQGQDEIALGNALSDEYKIGDTIKIKIGGNSHIYKITGYVQSVNNNGLACELTNSGYAKISDKSPSMLNVYLKDTVAAKDFISQYESSHSNLIAASVNYEALSQTTQNMYSGIIKAVTSVIFLLAVLIILLVMYITINSLITRLKQEFGIYKAVGYSSRQLVLQAAGTFIPVIGVSAGMSACLGFLYIPVINNAIFGIIGAVKNHFEVPALMLLLFVFAFAAVSFIISLILAAPIKKINAYSLLKE